MDNSLNRAVTKSDIESLIAELRSGFISFNILLKALLVANILLFIIGSSVVAKLLVKLLSV